MVSDSLTRPSPEHVLTFSGELDIATAPALRRAAADILHDVDDRGLTIDLSDVPFADSSGVAALLAIRRMLGRRPLRLRGVQPAVQYTLHVLALDHLFPVDIL